MLNPIKVIKHKDTIVAESKEIIKSYNSVDILSILLEFLLAGLICVFISINTSKISLGVALFASILIYFLCTVILLAVVQIYKEHLLNVLYNTIKKNPDFKYKLININDDYCVLQIFDDSYKTSISLAIPYNVKSNTAEIIKNSGEYTIKFDKDVNSFLVYKNSDVHFDKKGEKMLNPIKVTGHKDITTTEEIKEIVEKYEAIKDRLSDILHDVEDINEIDILKEHYIYHQNSYKLGCDLSISGTSGANGNIYAECEDIKSEWLLLNEEEARHEYYKLRQQGKELEAAEREAEEKQKKLEDEAKERAEYERLKAKFENNEE